MMQCPKCYAYMTPHIKGICGDYKLIYDCTCGYSSEDERVIVGVDIHIDRDVESVCTDHT